MSFSRQDVAKVARLSRIAMTDAELDTVSDQLARVIDYFDKLSELDTDGVEPLSHALPVANVFRDDVPAGSLSQANALANAPEKTRTSFKVPRVIDDGSSA